MGVPGSLYIGNNKGKKELVVAQNGIITQASDPVKKLIGRYERVIEKLKPSLFKLPDHLRNFENDKILSDPPIAGTKVDGISAALFKQRVGELHPADVKVLFGIGGKPGSLSFPAPPESIIKEAVTHGYEVVVLPHGPAIPIPVGLHLIRVHNVDEIPQKLSQYSENKKIMELLKSDPSQLETKNYRNWRFAKPPRSR